MAFNWSQFGEGAMTSAASGAIGSLLGMAGARVQRKQQEKLMAKQFDYAKQAFRMENERQNELLQTAPTLQIEGMKAAGLSPSDPDGTGYSSPSNNNVEVPSVPGTAMPYSSVPDVSSSMAALASSRLANSQAALNEIEERYRAKQLEGKISALNTEIEQKRALFPQIVEKTTAEIQKLYADKRLSDKQADVASQQIDNLKASLDGIRLDNKYNERTLDNRVSMVGQELANLVKDGRIKEAEAKLADLGIVVGQDGLGMLFSALLNGKGSEILDTLSSAIGEMLKAFPAAVASLFTDMIDSVVNAPKRVVDKLVSKVTGK